MNNHNYNVLEFDKLKGVLAQYMMTKSNRDRVENLKIYSEINQLKKEFEILRDFIDFHKYDVE